MQLIKIYLCLLFLSIISCNGEKIDDKIIYTIVLNQTIKPLPPIPPPNVKNEEISKKILDSLNNVPLNIALYPFKLVIKNFNLDFSKENLKNLQIEESTIPIHFKNINARPSIRFDLIKNNRLKELKTIFKKHDGLLYISDIKFNNYNNKAIVAIGYSYGKLSSGIILYYLEKKNNQWVIINKSTKSIS